MFPLEGLADNELIFNTLKTFFNAPEKSPGNHLASSFPIEMRLHHTSLYMPILVVQLIFEALRSISQIFLTLCHSKD